MDAVQNKPRIKTLVAINNFVWVFVVPHLYYGWYLGQLKFNLIF
jgi:hypothetical protein